jgi:hypothetical protein
MGSSRMSSSRTNLAGFNSPTGSVRHMMDLSHHTADSADDDGDDKVPENNKFESALLQYSRAIMKGATDFDPKQTDDLEKAISETKQAVISLFQGAHLDFDIERRKHTQELLVIKGEKQDMEKELESDIVNLKAELLKEKEASGHWLSAYLKEEKKSQALLEQIEGKKKVDGSKKRKRMVKMWERAEKAKFDEDDK